MLAGILQFEWRYHTRQVTLAVVALALALISVMLVGTGYGPDGVDINSPYTVMQTLGLMSLAAVFVLTVLCANAALRDVEHRMTEIVFATPIGKLRYLFGRFAGALLAATTVMAIAALVLMIAPLILQVEPERLGAVRPLAYVWALLVLVIPNLVLVGALLFAVATFTRSTLATYVAGVAVYALYFVTALLISSPLMAGVAPPTPEGLARAALLDPFGLSAFFEQTRYWTPAERDTRFVALSGRLLQNRLLWLGLAAAVLALTYYRFSFRLDAGGARVSRKQRVSDTATDHFGTGTGTETAGRYRAIPLNEANARTLWPALRSAVRLELRHVLRGWTFLALLAMWAFVAGMEAVAQLGGGEYGTRVLPTTGLLLDAMQLPLLLLGTVTIVYYAAEVAWRERMVGIDALVDATPASSAVLYLAKAAALCALPMVMVLVAILVGVIVQLVNGQMNVQPALYLTLFWFGGVPLALFAIGALALQAMMPNRWLGMLAGLVLALIARRGEVLGLEHPMLRFGSAPATTYSEIGGFGPIPASFAAFMLYWTAAAAVLACVSWGVWRRGLDPGVRKRLAGLRRTWGRKGTRVAAVSAGAFAIVGSALFWQTNIAHAWEGSDAQARWRADYERAYRHLERRAQPGIVAVRTTVDLFPSRRRAQISGVYVLENRNAEAIDTVWVIMPDEMTTPNSAFAFLRTESPQPDLTLAGARLLRHDARFGVHVFQLERPLAPGARTELRFARVVNNGGIRAAGFEYDVATNGTVLTSGSVFPDIGYRAGYELSDPALRREYGLTADASTVPPLPRSNSARAAVHAAGPQVPWIMLDATVTTDSDQTALAPGRLVSVWESDGRRNFHYVSDKPVTPQFAFVSARYAVQRVQHGNFDVEVWYHPAHGANVPRIVNAATRALDELGARHGAYPYPVLRIAEVPAWAQFGAFALPTLVLFTEDRGFLSDPRADDVDLITRRVAHEVAHQWWGHTLDPADVAGGLLLVETLAKYSEQLVVAAVHGEAMLPALLAFDEDRYLAGRAQSSEAEPVMLDMVDQAYLYYGKGAIVMNALRDLLGATAVNRALNRVLALGGPNGAATSLDLRDALYVESPGAEERQLIDEWLGDRVVYDMRVDTATVTKVGDGRFRVRATIGVAKFAQRGKDEVSRALDQEAIDVAIYDDDPTAPQVLYAGKQRVTGGRIELARDVSRRPAYVVVDPFVRRIDRDRSDNRKRLPSP